MMIRSGIALLAASSLAITLVTCTLASPLGAQRMPSARPAHASCAAPLAPINVEVTPEVHGGDIALWIDVAPRAPLEGLTWEVEAHGPAVLVDGPAAGALPGRGGRRRAVVSVPGSAYAEVDVLVSGFLRGTDERVTVLRTMTWGTPPSPGEPVDSLRGRDGTPLTVTSLPTAVLDGPRTSPSLSAAGGFVVSGRFLFEDKAWGYGGWTGEDPLVPVRRADVTVIDAGAAEVLATGQTDAEGRFALACRSGAESLDLVVRCDAAAVYDPGFQATQVVALEGWVQAMFATPVLDHPTTADVDVGTTVSVKVANMGGKEGNAFNVHDTAVAVFETLPLAPVDELIEHHWPAADTHAFVDSTYIGPNHGYDDAVIAHEIGHVIDALFTDYNGGGGSHSFGDSDQNPALSLSEGFATLVTGLTEVGRGNQALYVDSSPAAQTGGAQLRLRHETAAPYAFDAKGIADEVAVACALYDVVDTSLFPDATPGEDDDAFDEFIDVDGLSGAEAFWHVLTTPPVPSSQHTLNDVWDSWHAVLGDAVSVPLAETFAGFEQRFTEDAREPNDQPEDGVALEPISGSGGWTTGLTLYRDDGVTLGPGEPDVDWFRHELVVGSQLRFVTRYPGGANDADTQADTQLELYDPDGVLAASDLDSGVGRNARILEFDVPRTGTWTVAVSAQTVPFRRYGRYEYRALWLFQNFAPVLDDVMATPAVIPSGGTSVLSALVSDPNDDQAVEVVWTPLDGGDVDASGHFTAPGVQAPTTFRVEARAVDELGAESAPALVEVLVEPAGCATPASVRSLGGGKAGSAGVPQLVVDGEPVLGTSSATLRASQLVPGSTAQLVIGFSLLAAPFDGGTLFPAADLLLPVTVDASGGFDVPLAVPAGVEACGLTVIAQVLVPGDPQATGSLQTAQSNGVALVLGS